MSASGLKEKLRELERAADRPRPGIAAARKRVDLAALLGGEEREGCWVVERRYSLQETHGPVRLSDLFAVSGAALGIVAKNDRLAAFDPRQALFLDTETTGLAGGTGTMAFLVGVGYFEGDSFVVRQYFLAGPQQEGMMLAAVHRHVQNSATLVTFNGKSFDLPLLLTRCILNRFRPQLEMLPHIDVLHAARRMWKPSWQDCSLGNLEYRILGKTRSADVPSALIPGIYFDFLRSGNPGRLPEVFAHNREDLVTTAALLTYLGALVQSPFKWRTSAQELRQIGKLYREAGEYGFSAQTFRALIASHEQDRHLEDFLALAYCYKSQRRHEEACQIWQHVIDNLSFHPLPFIELAKHFEHRARRLPQAHALAERALRAVVMLEELQPAHEFLFYKNDLQRRLARLQRKLSG